MNRISKELKNEIERKVEYALTHRDNVNIAVITEELKPHLKRLRELRAGVESEVEFLTNECESHGLWFHEFEKGTNISAKVDRSEIETVLEKVIVQLQYSKEPDFLKLIDSLVSQEVPSQSKKILQKATT